MTAPSEDPLRSALKHAKYSNHQTHGAHLHDRSETCGGEFVVGNCMVRLAQSALAASSVKVSESEPRWGDGDAGEAAVLADWDAEEYEQAVAAVLAYGAEPPEYPHMVLVPATALAALRSVAPPVARLGERLRVALARLDAPMDWDRDSAEDRLSQFVAEVRAAASSVNVSESDRLAPYRVHEGDANARLPLNHVDGIPRTPRAAVSESEPPEGEYVDPRSLGVPSATLRPEDGLDAAWREAEAALPEGWMVEGVNLAGIAPTQVKAGWVATAVGPWSRTARSRPAKNGYGPTPAAALRSLRAALTEPDAEETR